MSRPDNSSSGPGKRSSSSRHRNPLVPNLKSISRRKNKPTETSLLSGASSMDSRSNLPSNDSMNQMLKIPQPHIAALKTRNPSGKRHSIMITSYDKRGFTMMDNDDDMADDDELANESDLFIDLNTSFNSKHRPRSLASFSNLADDEFNSTMDSDTILKDLDNQLSHNNNNYRHKTEDSYLSTLNTAFSEYSKNISGMLNTNIETDDSSDNDSFGAPNKKFHPLRKLVINSPNSSPSPSKMKAVSPSSSRVSLKKRLDLAPRSSSKRVASLTLDPKNLKIKSENYPIISSSSSLLIEPTLPEDKKPQCQIISNCIFFGPVKERPQSPVKPSEVNALDVFDDNDHSPIKRRNPTILANFATALVDPELFSKSAGSVFSGPITLSSRQRTTLHFV